MTTPTPDDFVQCEAVSPSGDQCWREAGHDGVHGISTYTWDPDPELPGTYTPDMDDRKVSP